MLLTQQMIPMITTAIRIKAVPIAAILIIPVKLIKK